MIAVIRCGRVYTGGKFVTGKDVVIDGGRIGGIKSSARKTADFHFPGLTLLPGFIDVHAHGAEGCSVMDCEEASVAAIARAKLKEGVTLFCPTAETATIAKLKRALFAVKAVKDAQARNSGKQEGALIHGAFLEGPFIGQEAKRPRQILREPSEELLTILLESAKGAVSSVLIAPELRGAANAVRFLAGNGVKTRFGRTAATYEETEALIEAGADCCAHTFLRMSPITGEDVGAAGAALLNENVFAEAAPLGAGVSPPAVRLAARFKKGKLICVTNGGEGAGAGMNRAVTALAHHCGLSEEEAADAATEAPAKYLGVYDERGSLDIGKIADLTALDGSGEVAFTFAGGELAYCRWV